VEEVIAAFDARFTIRLEEVRSADESIVFNLPRELRDVALERVRALAG
jgi:4-hydroxy-3-methylbut-2-enyl diphosphate reductase